MEEEYIQLMQGAYIAYYGRPADPDGLAFWVALLTEAGGDLSAIIEAFGTSLEFTERYGSLSYAELVNGLYEQLFNREADADGLDFYVNSLVEGSRTLQTITLDILYGAQNSDIDISSAKIAFAQYFTQQVENGVISYAGNGAADAAKQILALVGLDTLEAEFETILSGYSAGGGEGVALLSEDLQAFLSIVELNANAGVLSTEALRDSVIELTSQSDYEAAFDPSNYDGAEDGVFTGAELGFDGFGDLPATQETLESLMYGTMINALKAFDLAEVQELTAFVEANPDLTGLEQDYIDLLVSIFEDEGNPPLYDDATVAQIVVTGTAAFVEVAANGINASIFDGLLDLA
ncbi:MAG TPA: hypothetical protein DCF62_06920 [Porticoccaceae bacterium]|nr:hypothetical protein [Porticoccaceae bacterium]HCO59615.1 hypothetical protein [Porticoccaceae bacterium]